MAHELVLGVDLSTHGVKVVAVNTLGELCALSTVEYNRIIGAGGIQEQPLEPVWAATCQALRSILDQVGTRIPVSGLSVTHQRGTLIALDVHGKPIGPAICDSDTRSWNQARWLQTEVGNEWLYQRTGCPPLPFNGLSKILWWLREQPMTGQRIGHWLSLQDWMVWMLTRVLKSSPGSAMRLGVLDIHHPWKYAPDVLELAGIAPNTLPPLANFKQVLGHVCHQASQETGLQQGTPVFPAPGDQPAAFAGSGALPQGAALASLGTSFLVSFAVDRFVPARAGGQYTLEVLPDGLYTLELGEGAGTNVLDWLRVNLLDIPSIKMLNELAAASPPGANDLHVIPHWWAILDEQRSGRIDGLRSHHTRADIVRAALESLVYELRHAWDKLVAASGISPQQIVVCGGAASNLILCQIIADVFACPILKPVTNEASALGAAISATLGLGWFETLDQAARVFSHCQATLEPDASNVTFYQSAYQDYLTRLT